MHDTCLSVSIIVAWDTYLPDIETGLKNVTNINILLNFLTSSSFDEFFSLFFTKSKLSKNHIFLPFKRSPQQSKTQKI